MSFSQAAKAHLPVKFVRHFSLVSFILILFLGRKNATQYRDKSKNR